MPPWTEFIWYGSIGVQAALIARLMSAGLSREFPFFTSYLVISLTRTVLSAVAYPPASNGALPLAYTYFWLWTEPISLVLQTAVALEVHGAISSKEDGRTARRILYIALAAAALVATAPLGDQSFRHGGITLVSVLQSMMRLKTSISTILAVFLIDRAAAFAIVPGALTRPRMGSHSGVLAMFFGLYAAGSLAVILAGGSLAIIVNSVFVPAITVCLLLWLYLLKPGPRVPQRP